MITGLENPAGTRVGYATGTGTGSVGATRGCTRTRGGGYLNIFRIYFDFLDFLKMVKIYYIHRIHNSKRLEGAYHTL